MSRLRSLRRRRPKSNKVESDDSDLSDMSDLSEGTIQQNTCNPCMFELGESFQDYS